jgi:hypothetical protein
VWVKTGELGTPQFVYNPDVKTGAKTTGQVIWSPHITNYGKSPAIEMSFDEKSIQIGMNSPFYKSFTGERPYVAVPIPLAPTEDDITSVISNPGIDPSRLERGLGSEYAITIHVKITYTDLDGNAYETCICLRRQTTGSIEICEGSYIH